MSQINKEKALAEIEEQYRLFENESGNVDENNPAVAQIKACVNIITNMDEDAVTPIIPGYNSYSFACGNCRMIFTERLLDEYDGDMHYCPNCGYKLKRP